jgi:hypothetical protein
MKTVTVYPNPVKTELRVTGLQAEAPFVLTDLAGKVLSTGLLTSASVFVDCSSLSPGMYLLHVNGHAIRFIKD